MADGGHEPSMEDILSSIKRIIAEDSDAALSGSRGRRSVAPARADRHASDQDDVLELTEAVAVDAPPLPVPAASPAPPTRAAVSEPQPQQQDDTTVTLAKAAPKSDPTLVSTSTLEASRSSLAALSALVVKPEVTGTDTLEGLVRDMLRPMIAQWLDARLPEIVERHVAQEVRRIAERG